MTTKAEATIEIIGKVEEQTAKQLGYTLVSQRPALAELERITKAVTVAQGIPQLIRSLKIKGLHLTVTASPKGKRNCQAWFKPEAWKLPDGTLVMEINICAEYLLQGEIAITEAVTHEVAHLRAYLLGEKDTSNNGSRHNKKFKNNAEIGPLALVCGENSTAYGYGITSFTADAMIYAVENIKPNASAFTMARLAEEKRKKNAQTNRHGGYRCGRCQTIARASKNGGFNGLCITCLVEITPTALIQKLYETVDIDSITFAKVEKVENES